VLFFLLAADLLALVDSTAFLLSLFDQKVAALPWGENRVVSIVHIGDSHIQAGFQTERIRERFQRDFGIDRVLCIIAWDRPASASPEHHNLET
jgi:hypothetical protein